MAEENSLQDRIEAYTLGEMTPQERADFKREVAGNPALANMVEEYRLLQEDLGLLDEADFLTEMKELGDEMRTEPEAYPEARPFRRRWYMAVAAAVLLLLVPAYLFLRPSPENALFDSYFEAYPDVSSARADGDAEFVVAMEEYREGDYEEALVYFSDYLAEVPGDQEALFYGGIAEAKAGDPEVAVERLERLEAQESIFEDAARWYRALALLKGDEVEEAAGVLREIVAGGGSYAERAAELLGELDE